MNAAPEPCGEFNMLSRRQWLKTTASWTALAGLTAPQAVSAADSAGVVVNDVQSQLNATRVDRIIRPQSIDDIASALQVAERESRAVSVAGGRHAMGGQQFGSDGLLLDMTQCHGVVGFDRQQGLIEVRGGTEWPELLDYLDREQPDSTAGWAIRQKQTGVDRVSLGGSLASNVHGRSLRLPPIIGDVESFMLVDAAGKIHHCSRRENAELFSLAIGGYGLFGIIAQVTLRLMPRTKLQRQVEVIPLEDLPARLDDRLQQGFVYGDCPFSTDLEGDTHFSQGIFTCYRPVEAETPISPQQRQLTGKDWAELYTLARTDKPQAFDRFSRYYESTSGQIYWSDTQQRAGTFVDYQQAVDVQRGTEVITEIYVARRRFVPLLRQLRKVFRQQQADMTYGTIRFIEADTESFLPWAREPSVCLVINLHVQHTEAGKAKAAADFRRIIDAAIQFRGTYFLTYHRWATRQQVEACYPKFVEFLRLKKKYDPHERLQSDWYRHYTSMFADVL
jgi:FAD/FMN-containing dehydrogenase